MRTVRSRWGLLELEPGVKYPTDLWSALINHLPHIWNSSVIALCPLLSQSAQWGHTGVSHEHSRSCTPGEEHTGPQPEVLHAEIKSPPLITSVWSFFSIPRCFHTFSFTGCSEVAVQISHASSPTTQMTYGVSSVLTSRPSQSHFIKYKSKGNIWKSKSSWSNSHRFFFTMLQKVKEKNEI